MNTIDSLTMRLVAAENRVDELADAVGRFLRAHRAASCCDECWVSHVETGDDLEEGDEWGWALHELWVVHGDELGDETAGEYSPTARDVEVGQ